MNRHDQVIADLQREIELLRSGRESWSKCATERAEALAATQAANDRLREALEQIAHISDAEASECNWAAAIARWALAAEK